MVGALVAGVLVFASLPPRGWWWAALVGLGVLGAALVQASPRRRPGPVPAGGFPLAGLELGQANGLLTAVSLIDETGQLHQRSVLGQPAVLTTTLTLSDRITPYVRTGDTPALTLAFTALAAAVIHRRHRPRRHTPASDRTAPKVDTDPALKQHDSA